MRAAVLAAVLLGGVAVTAPVDLDLRDDGPSSTRPLAPGESISWSIGVTSGPVAPVDLRVTVSGDASSAMAAALQVSLQGCRSSWVGTVCPTGAFPISAAEPLVRWQERQVAVMLPDGRIPAAVEVLAVVGLSGSTTDQVQGERAIVRIGFTATGLICQGDCSAVVEPLPGPAVDLPYTGVSLLWPVVAGILAVLAGVGLARWGSVRWR